MPFDDDDVMPEWDQYATSAQFGNQTKVCARVFVCVYVCVCGGGSGGSGGGGFGGVGVVATPKRHAIAYTTEAQS